MNNQRVKVPKGKKKKKKKRRGEKARKLVGFYTFFFRLENITRAQFKSIGADSLQFVILLPNRFIAYDFIMTFLLERFFYLLISSFI
jgi:hypothetical protein